MKKSNEDYFIEALKSNDAPAWVIESAKMPPLSPLEQAEKFFIQFADADSIEEVMEGIKRIVSNNPIVCTTAQGLVAIETLLATPQEPGVLSNLVAWGANWVLDDPSDEGAKRWLRHIAEGIRTILGEKAPPRLNG